MSENYPLYPQLSEQGVKEFEAAIEQFKKKLAKAAEETIGNLYQDLSLYIESDHWTNYRNKIVAGFRQYDCGQADSRINFKELREAVFREHRDELIEDLNADLQEENERLKDQVKRLQEDVRRLEDRHWQARA